MDSDFLEFFIQLGLFALLISVGFFAGTFNEKRHMLSIRKREAAYNHMPAMTSELRTLLAGENRPVAECRFVASAVVISEDYFKGFLAGLKTVFGGRLTSYESLLDRARREAILRLKEQAPTADAIVNLRLEPVTICKEGGEDGKGPKAVELMAMGTAIRFAEVR
jgi:uncharacterized protein YbjQ (UPF0145 family)